MRVQGLLKPLISNFFMLLIAFTAVFYCSDSLALRFIQEWEKVAGVTQYEFQISENINFNEGQLVKSGTTREQKIDFNLKAGIYFFRLRSQNADQTEVGSWSRPIQVRLVDETLEIVKPKNAEKVALLSQASELKVEWNTSNDSLDDYQLRLDGPQKQIIFVQTKEAEVTVPRLGAGLWRLQLFGRRKTQVVFTSPVIEVELLAKENFVPRIVQPVDSETLLEFAEFDVKWIKKVKGQHSEILFARADHPGFPIVFREEISTQGSYTMRGMPVGLYQMTIRDYDDSLGESVDSTVTLKVLSNPEDLQPENINITSRMLLGPYLGIRKINTPSMGSLSSQADIFGGLQLDGELKWRFLSRRTLEIAMGSGAVSQNLVGASSTNQKVENYRGPTEGYLRLGYGYYRKIPNSAWDWGLKIFGEYQLWRAPVCNENIAFTLVSTCELFSMQNFGTVGFGFGTEFKYRVKPLTHLEFRGYIPLPILTERGMPAANSNPAEPKNQLGTGKWAEFYFPKLELIGILRHKFSREFWISIGIKAVLGFTAVRENTGNPARTLISEFSVSPRFGLDWDI